MASKVSPLPSNVPIADEKGNPTPFFARQLKQLLDEKADVEVTANAAKATADAAVPSAQFLAQLLADLGGDPNEDRLLFWDDSLGTFKFLSLGTNLTIADNVLNAAGGGGGSGNWWKGLSVPKAADFPTVWAGTGAVTAVDDADLGLVVSSTGLVNTIESRIRSRTITLPTSDWTVTARMTLSLPTISGSGAGIYLIDSVANRCILAGRFSNAAFCFMRLSLPTGYNSNPFNPGLYFGGLTDPYWIRLQRVGTNLVVSLSGDGKNFTQVHSESATAWLTNNANQIGIGMTYQRTTGDPNFAVCDYWSQSW